MKPFALVFTLFTLIAGSSPAQAEARPAAIVVSYQTPNSSRGLNGRFELVEKLEALGYRVTVVSDRFEKRTDAIPPSPENLVQTFNRLAHDPDIGKLLVVLDLHGVPRKPQERSHSVLFGSQELSLDRFVPGLRVLRRRDVPVALLDLSCYSGASLPLAHFGACVASTGSDHSENYPSFVDTFADALKPALSFEDAFLVARRNHRVPRTPRISSPAGRAAMREERIFDTLFDSLDRAPVLAAREEVDQLAWNEAERLEVVRSFEVWKSQGEIHHGQMLPYLPDYLEASIRFNSLVDAERSLYERNLRRYRDSHGRSRCSNFTF
jgi:hypothetical protein